MYGRHERITRQELYDLIWSTPATKLSERFQLSGRGLGKLCERYGIPVPERGWWAKQAAGHAVERTPLPKAASPYMENIELWVREDWRQYLTEQDQSWFEERMGSEATLPVPVVRDEDDSRHPLIVRARRERKENESAPLHFGLTVSKELRVRALRIATAIVEGCELRGYKFVPRPEGGNGAADVVAHGQRITITIDEPYSRVPHVLTKSEAREKALGRGWSIPEFDSVRSSSLMIALDHTAQGERRSFAETTGEPLEARLPDLFKALPKIALRMRADENYAAEQARRRQEEAEWRAETERVRREEEARAAAEQQRRDKLLRASARFRESREILELVEAVEGASKEQRLENEQLIEWLAHARSVAARLNPVPEIMSDLSTTV